MDITITNCVVTYTHVATGYKLNVCPAHRAELDGPYQVSHGSHEVTTGYDLGDPPVHPCDLCTDAAQEAHQACQGSLPSDA